MKDCVNCIYFSNCTDSGQQCEFYYPVFRSDNVAIKEYEEDLKLRAETYRDIEEEFED